MPPVEAAARLVGGSLEAEEGIKVDRSNFNAICSGVVGIDSTSSSNGVLLVAPVAWTCLRKTKRDTNCWLQLPIGCRPCDEVRESAKKTLGEEAGQKHCLMLKHDKEF